jgi:adenine/guanine phosphoribosyltransferase-like PRPP-binding protein
MDAAASGDSTEGFWQSFTATPETNGPPYSTQYAVKVSDNKFLSLPIRVLPGGQDRAVASLILTQASFEVAEGVSEAMAELAERLRPDVIIGLPTLGLAVAPLVARRLGFSNYVALGYSRKFWYRDDLSVSVSSITTPDQDKRIYLDPNVIPRLHGRRAVLVDDVVSRGTTMAAAQRLLAAVPVDLVGAVVAMAQTDAWWASPQSLALKAVFKSPLLERRRDGWWPIGA